MIAQHSDFGGENMLLAHVDTLLLGLVFQQSNLTLQTNDYALYKTAFHCPSSQQHFLKGLHATHMQSYAIWVRV